MHKLLERQLRSHFGDLASVPAELAPLVDAVSRAYEEADGDRALLERSLELSSQELLQRFQALRKQQNEQQVIFNSAPALIFYKDTENRILRLNELGARAMGRPIAELEGKSCYDVMPHDVAKRLHDDDLEVVRSGQPKLGIVESHPDASGVDHWVRTDKVPYRDETGKVVGVVVFSQDITEQKKAEEDLKAAYRKLEELVKFRTQFLNTTAHELRTPLTPIILQSHLLRDALSHLSDPQQRKGFEILDRNIRRLDSLVRDVLDAARLQSGRLPLRVAELDMARVVGDAVETVAPQAEQQHITLESRSERPLLVAGDPVRLGQVLTNLLANALKFTPEGGKITVTAVASSGHAIVSVQDTGIGVPPGQIARLFQPFSQVHDPMQTTAPGTGLGLYVSRGIVEQHGGNIWCYSAGPNAGSTFSFRLPLLKPGAPIVVAEKPEEPVMAPATPTTAPIRP
ncbi:MAG: PAS domain-containing sensor histidine kinase [Euryarchaeota archaeon]|nr:PAS domain-containing sensor histidine kinase [Euryarchaeota archaeon]